MYETPLSLQRNLQKKQRKIVVEDRNAAFKSRVVWKSVIVVSE